MSSQPELHGSPLSTEAGIYRDMPEEEYRALDAVNASSLKRLFASPAAFKYSLKQPESRAQKGGTYAHMAVLEPDRFAREALVAPRFHAKWKDESAKRNGYDGGKESLAVFEAENGVRYVGDGEWENVDGSPCRVISGAVRDEAMGIAEAVQECPAARGLLTTGDSEVVLVWDDPTGVRCKARLDKLYENNLDGWTVADLKKTTSVRPEAFQREIDRLRMYLQAAFYLRGIMVLKGQEYDPLAWHQPNRFVWVAFESAPPHFCRVYQFTASQYEQGFREIERMLRVVAWCEREGSWPDLSTHVRELGRGDYVEEYKYPDGYREVE